MFEKFDKDGNGFLDRNEAKALLKRKNPQMTDQEIDQAIDMVDFNDDGQLSFKEFMNI